MPILMNSTNLYLSEVFLRRIVMATDGRMEHSGGRNVKYETFLWCEFLESFWFFFDIRNNVCIVLDIVSCLWISIKCYRFDFLPTHVNKKTPQPNCNLKPSFATGIPVGPWDCKIQPPGIFRSGSHGGNPTLTSSKAIQKIDMGSSIKTPGITRWVACDMNPGNLMVA